ncbi:hypothetical protein P167DRAFT_598159 [Morchella conica CCBAS932]|uniref:Uncharacterized protein n=1 Tax=Morchella conica CCBAS932 TaxID=1392247 RepID=A0A3N4KAW3_9PEZI|nr:hypothetical protein P167DRAFT_598159 [Morchella conica CCBAS932]
MSEITFGTPAATATLEKPKTSESPKISGDPKTLQEPRAAEQLTTLVKKDKEAEGPQTPEEPNTPAQQPEPPKKPRTPRADLSTEFEPEPAEEALATRAEHVESTKVEAPSSPLSPATTESDDDNYNSLDSPESPPGPVSSPEDSSPEDSPNLPSPSPSPSPSPPSSRGRHTRHSRSLRLAPLSVICRHTHVTHSGCVHTESTIGRICRKVELCADGVLNNWQQLGDCDMCDDSKNLNWDMDSMDGGDSGNDCESESGREDYDGEDEEGLVVGVGRKGVGVKKAEEVTVTESPAGLRKSNRKRAHEDEDEEETQRRKRRRVSFDATLQIQHFKS